MKAHNNKLETAGGGMGEAGAAPPPQGKQRQLLS